MKIISEEVLRNLINIFKINGYRVEVYRKLIDEGYSPELHRSFQAQVDESTSVLKSLNPILDSSLEFCESPVLYEDVSIDQSQFYFGMARASSNVPTVMISCRFGDEFLMKTYQNMLNFIDINAMLPLRETLIQHLSSLKNMYVDYDKYAFK